MADNLKSQAIKGVAWSMVETYSGQIVQFAISIVLARLLSPDEFGLIGMLAIFIGLSTVFIDGGFSSALIQRKDRSQHDLSTVFIINTAMAILVYAVLFVSAPWIADFYNQPILKSIVRIYGLTLIIGSLGSTSSVQLTVKLDFKTLTKISLVSAILSGFVGIGMAYAGFGVWALVYQSILSSLFRLVLLFIYVKWIPRTGFSRESFRSLFSFSSRLFTASIISSVYDNITGAVIGKQFNSAALAYYNRAAGFNSLVNSNVTSVLGKVSYPLLSQIQDDTQRLKSVYQRYIQMSAFLTFPALMLLCAMAKPLVLVLLGAKWEETIILLQILSFGVMTDGVIVSNLNLIRVKGRSDVILKLESLKKTIAFSILTVSILMDSVLAICVGKAVYGGIIALYLNTLYTKKLFDYGFAEQFREYSPYLIISFLMLALGLGVSSLISNSWIALMAGVPVCVFFYLFVCARLRLYAYIETKKLVLPMLPKRFRKDSGEEA